MMNTKSSNFQLSTDWQSNNNYTITDTLLIYRLAAFPANYRRLSFLCNEHDENRIRGDIELMEKETRYHGKYYLFPKLLVGLKDVFWLKSLGLYEMK